MDSASRELLRLLQVVCGTLFILLLIAYLATLHWEHGYPRDFNQLVIGRDFVNLWMAGVAAWHPGAALDYDMATYWAKLRHLLGEDYSAQQWSYPPTVLLLGAPFAWLPYLAALATWLGGSIALFLAITRREDAPRWLLLASPAALLWLVSGQSSLLFLCAFLLAFRWIDRRPLLAGIAIGCLTLKPQLGLLFPLMLLAAGRWKVIASAVVTTLLLAGIAALLWGADIWRAYLTLGIPAQAEILLDPPRLIAAMMPTFYMEAKSLGGSNELASALQALATLGAAIGCWRYFRRKADLASPETIAMFATLSVLFTSYFMAYDLLLLAWAALCLLARGAPDRRGRVLIALVVFLPILRLFAGMLWIPGTSLILVAFAHWLWQRQRTGMGEEVQKAGATSRIIG